MNRPDPTVIFEHFRGAHATELLTAAIAEWNLFGLLAGAPSHEQDLQSALKLADRPLAVLMTALRAMQLVQKEGDYYSLTELSRNYLVPGGPYYVGDYIRLAEKSPGVIEMIRRLKTNRPANADNEAGAAFIYKEGLESAMDAAGSARFLTLALAGRAKNVAPPFAQVCDLADVETILDVGAGTGIYTLECLQRFPRLHGLLFDRPEVLKVAEEYVRERGLQNRITLIPGDMFQHDWPHADVVLFSNILHDWDKPECLTLLRKASQAIPKTGQILIHDVFLDDDGSGPLPIALYSASLFSLTEGRAYSGREYRQMCEAVGLIPEDTIRPTAIHCGILRAKK